MNTTGTSLSPGTVSAEMTRDERSLLLFFECMAVDQGGRVNSQSMNADDHAIAKRWNECGFVLFGRIKACDMTAMSGHWCELSLDAWAAAAAERRARALRGLEGRRYLRTNEE